MKKIANEKFESNINRAEFDRLADGYYTQHQQNIAITGENPEYFSEYKILDASKVASSLKLAVHNIFDFGSGIGNSIPYLRKYFPSANIFCADVSARSMEISRGRFPGAEQYILIDNGKIPAPDNSQDLVFSACVLHHIPHNEHRHWLSELHRIARPGGLLIIFEHNPLNPLTVRAVNTCPLDANARLIRARKLRRLALDSGWRDTSINYRVFFPAIVSALRPLEDHLGWLCLGAQYRFAGVKPM